jgi:hypothetical protein
LAVRSRWVWWEKIFLVGMAQHGFSEGGHEVFGAGGEIAEDFVGPPASDQFIMGSGTWAWSRAWASVFWSAPTVCMS